MKKKSIIAILLTLVMCFALSGCGGGASATVYEVGDTVATDWAEFTLTEANVDQGVGIKFSIKNVGKEDLNKLVPLQAGGNSKEISALINVNYNDYILGFESSNCYSLGEEGRQYPYLDLPVLSAPVEYKAGMALPEEAAADTEGELLLEVELPNTAGATEIFKFKIR